MTCSCDAIRPISCFFERREGRTCGVSRSRAEVFVAAYTVLAAAAFTPGYMTTLDVGSLCVVGYAHAPLLRTVCV